MRGCALTEGEERTAMFQTARHTVMVMGIVHCEKVSVAAVNAIGNGKVNIHCSC